MTSLSFSWVLDEGSMWEQSQTLPCCDGSAATLWLSLQFSGQSWLWHGLLPPDPSLFTPKTQVRLFLQGFQCWQLPCAVQILSHHTPLLAPWICLLWCFPGAAASVPQHRGFCSNTFSIPLYMCSPVDLDLLVMLCPAKSMIYIIHVWLSYLGKL